MTIITRAMCGACQELKEVLESQDIEFAAIDGSSVDGMGYLARYFSGPDTGLPAVICEYQEEFDLVSQFHSGEIAIRRTW